MEKYVNMADIISAQELSDAETVALIELLFFAYRDFVSDPDEILTEFGFGLAHHRVFQKEGETDRRQRLLFLTDKGEALRQRLMAPQMARIRGAVTVPEGEAAHLYRKVLYQMVNPENRDSVRDWIDRASIIGDPDRPRG